MMSSANGQSIAGKKVRDPKVLHTLDGPLHVDPQRCNPPCTNNFIQLQLCSATQESRYIARNIFWHDVVHIESASRYDSVSWFQLVQDA